MFRLHAYIADWAVKSGMHEFGVVLVHDFAVYQTRVFGLLSEEVLEQEELHAHECREQDGGHHRHRRSRVC